MKKKDPVSMADSQSETRAGDFEAALTELEGIVKQLEDGGLALDKALVLFERGVELARLCKQRLDAAELRVAKLISDREGLFREESWDTPDPEPDPVQKPGQKAGR